MPAGPVADRVAARLRFHDRDGLLTVAVVERPGLAAIVIGEECADDVDALWATRIGPFARRLAGLERAAPGPAVLHDHDPELVRTADLLLKRLRTALRETGADDGRWTYDHIGSTAVPGLRAKRFVDLQLGVPALPGPDVDAVLGAAGLLPAEGARPDSPGVHRDEPHDTDTAPPAVYRKRLHVRPDPAAPVILHVRLLDSPWRAATVRFRDRLRADPVLRRAYERVKEEAALRHADDPDYDDYTRAKSAFVTRHR